MQFLKKFNQKLVKKDNAGFTLVELMVVVGIIGILSSVAIPNFRDYQSKTKTSEAKLLLSALFTAESAGISDYDMYVTCLSEVGMNNSGKYYSVGFAGTSTINVNLDAENAGLTRCSTGAGMLKVLPPTNGITIGGQDNALLATNPGIALTQVYSAGSSFIASAQGHIEPQAANGGLFSAWAINSEKVISEFNRGYSSNPGVGTPDVMTSRSCTSVPAICQD